MEYLERGGSTAGVLRGRGLEYFEKGFGVLKRGAGLLRERGLEYLEKGVWST